jgi:hypothetical protein
LLGPAYLSSLSSVNAVSVHLDTEGTSTVQISTDPEVTSTQVQSALSAHGNFSVVG